MRDNCTSGSMRGCWVSSMAGLVRHRQTKGAGTDRPDLHSGSQALLYPLTPKWLILLRHSSTLGSMGRSGTIGSRSSLTSVSARPAPVALLNPSQDDFPL